MESQYSNEQAQLLAERLGDSELRELLERLGSASFGGPEEPTVGAVVEATGASPVEVGRLLAEIRQESLERRFSETFDNHEVRINKLERTGPTGVLESDKLRILDELAEQEQRRRSSGPMALVIFIVALLVMGAIFAASSQMPVRQAPPREASPIGFGIRNPPRASRWDEI